MKPTNTNKNTKEELLKSENPKIKKPSALNLMWWCIKKQTKINLGGLNFYTLCILYDSRPPSPLTSRP